MSGKKGKEGPLQSTEDGSGRHA